MQVILIGFPGSGKTWVGREMSLRYGHSWVDLDEIVRQKAGLDVPQIFSRHGEAYFRELESRALEEALETGISLISSGGGTPFYGRNWALIRERAYPVFLDLSFELLVKRLQVPSGRPLLQGLDESGIRELYENRLPRYRESHMIYSIREEGQDLSRDLFPYLDMVIRLY